MAAATTVDIGTLITRAPGVCGGRPCLAGTRISVHNVVIEFKAGLDPQEIQVFWPHLSLEKIYAALAYYFANQEQVDAEILALEEEATRLETAYTSQVSYRNATDLPG